MAEKKKTAPKATPEKYRCSVRFAYWKGERISMGQEIEVTKADLRNAGLKRKLKQAFLQVGTVIIESDPIKLIKED